MEIQESIYIGSFPGESKCPTDGLPEFAFIGRSNVGKSSLINMLCGRKKLAYISNKPGKTQMLNYYKINQSWYVVDLPGYGYAKISQKKRKEWERMIQGYLLQRATLQCAFVLLDANVPPQTIDIEFINQLGEMRVPFVIAYTKLDRLKNDEERQTNIARIREALLEYWNELPPQFETSAERGWGRAEILQFIKEVNERVG